MTKYLLILVLFITSCYKSPITEKTENNIVAIQGEWIRSYDNMDIALYCKGTDNIFLEHYKNVGTFHVNEDTLFMNDTAMFLTWVNKNQVFCLPKDSNLKIYYLTRKQ